MSMKIPFFKSKQPEKFNQASDEKVPDHIAIIMDGNGRWAQKRGMPRFLGHKEGVTAVMKIVKAASQLKVKTLTLYTFSTENWKRPKAEVDFILKLPKQFLHMYLPDLVYNNVRIGTIGDMEKLPDHVCEPLQYAVDRTKDNDGLQLNFALNYGGRDEILHAMKSMFQDMNDKSLSMDELDEQQFAKHLYTAGIPEPDLLIRTGGEKRLSNFLLWQLAYAELVFTDVLWPDFSEDEFLLAIKEYQQRQRRYGGI
ncbi:isoprenyl transferase [Aciduricibacillus chroicocephali]|uniref:Isoprenyl transferase n=1 Tax=Aciduricibacillus chroicocephali TaxID=3054939 RepID=A0ABY9KUQ8_9BACI|nr:isoprenyl transferase [Bacillaceae bacterium 44XB]